MGASAARAVVLVEGESDRRAVETLALRRGRDLAAEGVAVVPVGGTGNMARFVRRYGPPGLDLRLAGLCDAGETRQVAGALERAGLGEGLDRSSMEALGFYVCEADLEDELIRALGRDAVEAVIGAQGELGPWRTFQGQPAQRGRAVEAQLRRFMGTRSGRKAAYGEALVAALPLERVPRPLDRVLAHVAA